MATMARVLVVCGAGASSTFLAHRMRGLAAEGGHTLTVLAGSESELPASAAGVDVVLIGPHLGSRFDDLSVIIEHEGAVAILLPHNAFTRTGGVAALDAALAACRAPIGTGTSSAADSHRRHPHRLTKETP